MIRIMINGINAKVANNLNDVELEGFGRGWINYASLFFPTYVELDKETGEKIKGILGKECKRVYGSIVLELSDEQREVITAAKRKQYEEFAKAIKNGKILIFTKDVGCDFQHLVLSMQDDSKWDFFYELLHNDYGIYEYETWGKSKDEKDVTEEVIAKMNEIDEKRKQEKEQQELIEESGKTIVRINECWECGRPRILGGKNGRLPYNTWKKANDEMWDLRKKAYDEIKKETNAPLAHLKPRTKSNIKNAAFETENFVYFIVSRDYCGC